VTNPIKRNGSEIHALMEKNSDTPVENVEVLHFAITAGENNNAKNAKGVRFAGITD
jgi:hypothetical protein